MAFFVVILSLKTHVVSFLGGESALVVLQSMFLMEGYHERVVIFIIVAFI